MTEDYERVRDALKRALAAKGWNPADLAREAGMDPGTVLDFLNGNRRPQLATRGKIETALDWPAGAIDDIAAGGAWPHAGPSLSVVPPIIEEVPVTDDDNEVLAAIRRDPHLSPESKSHFLNQYGLLRELSARQSAVIDGAPLPYVAHGERATPYDEDEERRLEVIAREARRRGDNEDVPPK